MLNEAIQSRMFASLERILGANNYRRKKTKMILGLRIINDQEFEINSVLPFPNLILQLASSNISVFLRQHDSDKLLGTGPYMVSNFDKKNQVITLQKNPYYIRKSFFYDQIIFNHKYSIQTDVSEVSPQQDNITNYNLNEYFISQTYFLGFNANNKKFINIQTRKYLSCLFPMKNLKYEHDSIIPMGIFGYNSTIHFECDNINIPPKRLTNYNLTFYLDSMTDEATNYCKILNEKSIQCNIRKASSIEELKNLKKNGSLEIFIARFMPTAPIAEDFFSSFYKDHPTNMFDNSGVTNFSSNFDNEYDKLYNIPPNSKDELMNVYTKLNKLIIQNYIARPISYGTAEKLWVKKGIYIPDIGITGLMGVDLTDVKME